jgi:hypothetical protein
VIGIPPFGAHLRLVTEDKSTRRRVSLAKS